MVKFDTHKWVNWGWAIAINNYNQYLCKKKQIEIYEQESIVDDDSPFMW